MLTPINHVRGLILTAILIVAMFPAATRAEVLVELRSSEFIFAPRTWGQSHSPTIVETSEGLVAAWYAGPYEGHPNVEIYLRTRVRSRFESSAGV